MDSVITGPFLPAPPYELDEREQRALQRAAEAGRAAASWLRELGAVRPIM
ncbi:hypothetical protein Kpho02_77920 [Kitasatospora phosalacinea]|uniref:Uncharacterized protein n=1 Tax=Kitasatospora phosalacinea TaxID=2065 RepID=A0A9W6QE06_9ACTN|nr:hypothetical protein [Kitasatospora phosalacinea]GLW75495.1 hypothetical protein Kpho02_77920 [Kitasatospora phosalacinea]